MANHAGGASGKAGGAASAIDPLNLPAELLGEREQAFRVIVFFRPRGAGNEPRVGRHDMAATRTEGVRCRFSFNFQLEYVCGFHGDPLS